MRGYTYILLGDITVFLYLWLYDVMYDVEFPYPEIFPFYGLFPYPVNVQEFSCDIIPGLTFPAFIFIP